ncbi:hypothetical protein U1769_24975, partial [Sphingomonas sp. ZT3P38]
MSVFRGKRRHRGRGARDQPLIVPVFVTDTEHFASALKLDGYRGVNVAECPGSLRACNGNECSAMNAVSDHSLYQWKTTLIDYVRSGEPDL